MGDIKLKRGLREVTFIKLPNNFAMRLKHGTVKTADELESRCGTVGVKVRHIESMGIARMDIFEVDDRAKLDDAMDILRASPHTDIVSHVYQLDENHASEIIPTGSINIQFKPDVQRSERERTINEFGLEVLKDLDFLPDSYEVKLSKESKENPLKIAAKLQQRREIQFAEPDILFKVAYLYQPSDPLYKLQWHLKNRGDLLCAVAGADVSSEEAWDYTKGSRDIVICVMDAGFDLSHPELNVQEKIVFNTEFPTDSCSDFSHDNDHHGTACAGLALAEDNGIGVVGLAPKCSFMPIIVPIHISDNFFVSIFACAMNHADIISCGWKAESGYFPLSTVMNAIIHKAAAEGRKNKKGCVILFAAGNDNAPLDGVKAGTQWLKSGKRWLNGFAVHPDVICVGASDSRDIRAFYGNYGNELAVCAPSCGGPNTRGIVTTDRSVGIGCSIGDYTYQFEGTSCSTSLAAGLAGLMLSINSNLTSFEVRRIMMETADKIDFGNGQYAKEHSPLYGHGRINANKALKHVTEILKQK